MWKWTKNKSTAAHALSTLIALIVLVFAGQASAGPNANAMLSLDLIANGGAGNQRNNGVTTGTVSGRGTTIAIEVFATGVTTSLRGMQIIFDFDASLLTFVKAENSAFLTIPERQRPGTNFASTSPVTLGASGFLARAEFTTAADVTGREFSIGIATVTLSENSALTDTFMPTNRIAFNATSTRFSLSLDADDAPGDQAVASVEVRPESIVAIQVFGAEIQNASGITIRFEYDATQVAYERFDSGGQCVAQCPRHSDQRCESDLCRNYHCVFRRSRHGQQRAVWRVSLPHDSGVFRHDHSVGEGGSLAREGSNADCDARWAR